MVKRNAVIMGGSKGLGLAIAKKLASEKWKVTIVSSNKDNLIKAQELLRSMELEVNIEEADATSEQDVEQLFSRIYKNEELGLCVNCVGKNLSEKLIKVNQSGEILKHDIDDWKRTININLNSTFICGREEAYTMISQKSEGVIINISTALCDGAYGQSAYVAAKSGINSLTKTWALELAKFNIRCVSIAPGAIQGDALIKACEKSESHKAYMDKLKDQIPLKRFAYESEVADTVNFIAENKYITGTVIKIDGGGNPPKVIF